VEYTKEGVPVVGGVGEWSLDKRKYFGQAPPLNLTPPPDCAQECAFRWSGMWNEATAALARHGKWYGSTGRDTMPNKTPFVRKLDSLGRKITQVGPWKFADGSPLFFYRRGIAYSKWGGGPWNAKSSDTVSLKLCSDLTLTFDSADDPKRFTYIIGYGGGKSGTAELDTSAPPAISGASWQHKDHPTVAKVLGEGPWHFQDVQPIAFLWGGVLATPNAYGTYEPIEGSSDLRMRIPRTLGYSTYRVSMTGCYSFFAVEEGGNGDKLKGWIPMKHVSMEYTHWRDAGGCKL